MRIGQHFKNLREAKGLSTAQVSDLIGKTDFQQSLLWDFEGFDDNDIEGWPITHFKRYCEIIGAAPSDYADIASSDLSHLALADLVRKRREEKSYSIEELAERIGYESTAVQALEENQKDKICLNMLRQVSSTLDIPFGLLLSKI